MPRSHPAPSARRCLRLAAASLLVAGIAVTQTAPAQASTHRGGTTSVRLITFNDFHGNLEPPSGSSGRVVVNATGGTVNAGGAAYLATHVKELRTEVKNSIVLSAGDSIGASPLPSALFHDEPTIEMMNNIGVGASVVGNHEFDEGFDELKRIQLGGCHPVDGCQFTPKYSGAKFPFLGANVTRTDGSPALLPFTVKFVDGMPVGIIGVTLKDLPSVVTADAVKDLKFGDEVEAIDKTANLLDRLGVRAQIVLMHQGDNTEFGALPDACGVAANGPATTIAKAASPKVDAFFTAHSHQQYNCAIPDPAGNPRPVIQGLSFGRLLSVVDLKISRRTRDVVRADTVATNHIVTRTVTPDPAIQALVEKAKTLSAPIANRRIGTITADLVNSAAPSGEIPLGDVITDAQLAATQANDAQIAITNPGGIRGSLTFSSSPAGEGDGVVTYGEAFTVQPFANILQTITLTGAQLDAVFEQQWQPQPDGSQIVRILQISNGLTYSWSSSAPVGDRVSNLVLNGVPVAPDTSYRVTVNNFLAGGGDGFTVFKEGTDLAGGPIDLDAFTAYLTANPNLAPPASNRITLTP
ncbi:MAG TPA: bifunctional metallophosphatase/5'-nucleotidase [Propionibacteriaceae bacterium]